MTPNTQPLARHTTESTVGAPRRPAFLDRVFALLSRILGADLRSLAALRIVLGLVVLVDLVSRWSEIRVHYTDAGLLPRGEALHNLNRWRWSLLLLNGTEMFVQAVFLIAIAVAIALILGYRSRLVSIALWALVVSLQTRNPLVLSAADTYLRVLLFWSMFLPLGGVWSLDRRLGRERTREGTWAASVATAALFLQIAFVYLFTALLKTGDEWRSHFTAIWYALGAAQLTTPFGAWLHQFPDLLQVLTFVSFAIEVIAPLVLFIPWRTTLMRLAGIGLIVGFQFGILLTMNIGLFPWISTFCMVCFLPAAAWDWLERRVESAGALASRQGFGVPRRDRSLAFAVLPPTTGPPDPDCAAPPTTDAEPTAVNRPAQVSLVGQAAPLMSNLAAALLLLVVLAWNIAAVSAYSVTDAARPVAYSLGLYQRWSMFAPRPPRASQWSVIRGTLANGEDVSLMEPLVHDDMDLIVPFTWERPSNIAGDYYGSKEWRKYLDALNEDANRPERRLLAGYLCRNWNRTHDGEMRLETVALFRVSEATLPNGAQEEQRRVERASIACA